MHSPFPYLRSGGTVYAETWCVIGGPLAMHFAQDGGCPYEHTCSCTDIEAYLFALAHLSLKRHLTGLTMHKKQVVAAAQMCSHSQESASTCSWMVARVAPLGSSSPTLWHDLSIHAVLSLENSTLGEYYAFAASPVSSRAHTMKIVFFYLSLHLDLTLGLTMLSMD